MAGAAPLPEAAPRRLTIARLGHRGDGVAEGEGGPVFVPFTLPGETVEAIVEGERGHLAAVVAASPERVAPPCALFGRCGGCALQHWRDEAARAWKAGLVAEALARAGLTAPVAPALDAHGEGRRRVTFHVRRVGDTVVAGFMEARSHRLVEVKHCPILVPALAGAGALAAAIGRTLGGGAKPLDVQATATDTGLDIDIRGHGPAGRAERERLVALAEARDLARLSLHGEVLVARREPLVAIGKARVAPPPGAFLQATAEGEAMLAGLVAEAVGGARKVADLFCGIGPFALRLAETRPVVAVDSDAAAIAALRRAADRTSGLKPAATEARDLFRRPLLPTELAAFGAVVFDPPRAGAEAQARMLAASKVPRIVAVSCDPGTFARDAAILAGGGCRLERVTALDQFRYSAHVEIVAAFARG